MKAAQNLDFVSKFLPIIFDILIVQRSNYPLSAEHTASDALGNSCYQAILSHPADSQSQRYYTIAVQKHKTTHFIFIKCSTIGNAITPSLIQKVVSKKKISR